MKDILEIKWPWEMVWSEVVDELLTQIKDALPSDHPLQSHELYPGIKWSRRPIFIVDDDTTGDIILMNFEKMSRWKRTKQKVPEIKFLKDRQEVQQIMNNEHISECSKYTV